MTEAVGTSTVSETAGVRARQSPVRTCIGCRQRAADSELLRVVVGTDGVRVVPDPHRRMPGRGAWVHRDPGCVDLAIRRRGFGRALRVPGPVDPEPVREHVGGQGSSSE